MIEAFSAELSLDLRPFSRYLSTQGVRHLISEESGKQVLRVVSEHEAEAVRRAFALWREQPELLATLNEQWERQVEPRPRRGSILNSLFQQAWMMPITFLLTVLCLLVAVFSGLGRQLGSLEFLLYPLLDSSGFFALLGDIDSLSEMLRTLTPMLLHFGELHLVFNLLWLWYFGKQIEPRLPFVQYGALILLLAFASNTAEYLVLGFNNFGGMSGVVCGLVSCAWVIQSLMPRSRLMITHAMFAGFIVIIIAMEVFAGAYIATAAHVGGLAAGLLLGLVLVTYHRLVLNKSVLSR